MNKFKDFGLKPEIIKSLEEMGFVEPSDIQTKAIPQILKSSKDLVGLAQTGTGKTAAFSLPILEKLDLKDKNLQALILCPTRELCLQISEDIAKLGKYLPNLKITSVYGGERIETQISQLKRGVQVVVGTPGRAHDLIRRKILQPQNIKTLVLDEADEMLDMGFKEDLDAILEVSSKDRQTLLFSATMSQSVKKIAERYMSNSQEIRVGDRNSGTANVSHKYYVIDGRRRLESLQLILATLPDIYGIVFCRTKHQVQELSDKLKGLGYKAEALHGDISQNLRTKIMARFKEKNINLLVATDVAARGIDVNNLSHVINFTLSDQDQAYTHRSGRTGRAQNKGIAISLVARKEAFKIKRLEKIIGQKFALEQLPSKKEIYLSQIESFLTKLKEVDISKLNFADYFSQAIKDLDMSPEEMLKRFIAYNLSDLMNFKEVSMTPVRRDFSEARGGFNKGRKSNGRSRDRGEANRGEQISLEISQGKKHGFTVKKFFDLINRKDKNSKKVDIGRINILENKTIFQANKSEADYIKKILNK